MTATMSHSPATRNYRRPATVEVRMVARGLAGTVGSAHQLLVKVHRLLGPIGACFAEAQAHDRAVGFIEPFETTVNDAPVPPVEDAAVAEEEADGDEDTARAIYRRTPTPEHRASWRRAARRHIARLTLLLRADEQADA